MPLVSPSVRAGTVTLDRHDDQVEPDWAALGFESSGGPDIVGAVHNGLSSPTGTDQEPRVNHSGSNEHHGIRSPARSSRIGNYSSADWVPERARIDGSQLSARIRTEISDVFRRTVLDRMHAEGHEGDQYCQVAPVVVDESLGEDTPHINLTTDEETDASIPLPSSTIRARPRRKAYRVRRRFTRIGRGTKYVQIYLVPKSLPEPSSPRPMSPQQAADPTPPPNTFLANLHSKFPDAVKIIEAATRHHNATGELLPPYLLPIFEHLSVPKEAITTANIIRGHFGLPLLGLPTNQIGLRRAMARTRERLYEELAAALILPSAPPPDAASVNGEGEEHRDHVELTPFSIEILKQKLPVKFGKDQASIRAFLLSEGAYGDLQGEVIWDRGVGRLKGARGGFTGKVLDSEGLTHVFVDHSNVLHGLLHSLYNAPPDALPPRHLRTLSLPCLSLLLRRGRQTPPGSLHLVASSPLKQNLDPLVRLGWEVSILKRVEVYEEEVIDSTATKLVDKPISQPNATHTGLRRYREQGVDEILHLKLLQALNQKETPAPKGSTVVLATGDAKGGQFNRDGFLGAVREALKRGWSVELWSFKAGLSHSWWNTAKKEGWGQLGGGRFSIYFFDDWAEQLVEFNDDGY